MTDLAVIGAGLIGRCHAALIADSAEATLSAIADPAPDARHLAEEMGVPWFPDLPHLLEAQHPDGIIIATPNQRHRADGEAAVAAGIPALVEKPLAGDVADAEALVSAADRAGVPLLVGHHRRHNPIIAAAKAAIARGELGRIVAVHAQFWLCKPDDYFEVDWRRQPGAGPVLINLIHDIDLLRHLCGEITAVQANETSAIRDLAVEDTAAAILTFENGALGTLTASDTVAAPWSWEMTAGENPTYPHTDQHCYLIGGTHGSLSLPQGVLWRHPGPRSWWEPIAPTQLDIAPADPLPRQLAHFCAVIRGEATPLVGGTDGLAAVRVIAAIKEAAVSGQTVAVA
ncbi:MAG: Gfo/Idh/MocA family oxidoreductase [Pseudomonadota bacterium]